MDDMELMQPPTLDPNAFLANLPKKFRNQFVSDLHVVFWMTIFYPQERNHISLILLVSYVSLFSKND